jgi:hypothetical protein
MSAAMLADLGVIEADAQSERPRYAETALVHAPEERVWLRGAWHDGSAAHRPVCRGRSARSTAVS